MISNYRVFSVLTSDDRCGMEVGYVDFSLGHSCISLNSHIGWEEHFIIRQTKTNEYRALLPT
jgi:hypothetical protein